MVDFNVRFPMYIVALRTQENNFFSHQTCICFLRQLNIIHISSNISTIYIPYYTCIFTMRQFGNNLISFNVALCMVASLGIYNWLSSQTFNRCIIIIIFYMMFYIACTNSNPYIGLYIPFNTFRFIIYLISPIFLEINTVKKPFYFSYFLIANICKVSQGKATHGLDICYMTLRYSLILQIICVFLTPARAFPPYWSKILQRHLYQCSRVYMYR